MKKLFSWIKRRWGWLMTIVVVILLMAPAGWMSEIRLIFPNVVYNGTAPIQPRATACVLVRLHRPELSPMRNKMVATILGVPASALVDCAWENSGTRVSDVVGVSNSTTSRGAVRVSFRVVNPSKGIRIWMPKNIRSFAVMSGVCRRDGSTEKYAVEWSGEELPESLTLRPYGRTPAQIARAGRVCVRL